jgi:hypothetical protein
MAKINMDFTNVSSAFDVLPEGAYDGEIVKAELKTNKAGDGQYINFEWEVTNPENDKKMKVWDIASLKPQALWKLKEVMEAFKMDTEGAMEIDLEDFVGQEATLNLAIDTYQGNERNVVKKITGFANALPTGGADLI